MIYPPNTASPLVDDLGRPTQVMTRWMNAIGQDPAVANAIFINVEDYGAVGNGSTDDSLAIQAAMNAAALVNAPIFFPPGTYLTSPLVVPATCAGMFGMGRETSVLYFARTAYAAATVMVDFTGNTVAPIFNGLGIDVQNAVFDGTYILQLSADRATVHDIAITGRSAFAIITRAGSGCIVDDVVVTGIGGNGFTSGVYADGSSTDLTVRNLTQTGDHAYCVNIANGVFNLIENCRSYAQGAATGAFAFVLTLCDHSAIVNCYSEDSYHEAFNLTDANFCIIKGCTARWDADGVDFGISIAGTVANGGANYNVVTGCTLYNSYSAALCVALHASNNEVSDNVAHDCGQRAGAGSAQILVYTDTAGQVCSYNRFSDNVSRCTTANTTYGVLESLAGGTTIDNNLYDRNTLLGYTTRYSAFAGTGTKAVDHEWETWTPTITNTGGGGFTTTVQAARYQLNGKGCSGVLVFTVTNAGGGGYINVTLPFGGVSANAGAATGFETATAGLAVGGSIGLTGINNLRTYNNTATAVLNYKFYITFNFEMG